MKSFIHSSWFLMPILGILILLNSWPAFALTRAHVFSNQSLWFWAAISIGSLLSMFIFPILILKYWWKENLSDYGFRLPDNSQQALKLTSIVLGISIIIVLILSQTSSFKNYYTVGHKITIFFVIEIALSLLYFIGEEFFFRGFLFFTLWKKLGYHTFWVTNILFALLHFSKASGEIVFSFFFGLLFSFLSYKTKSFFPAVIAHFVMALVLNLAIIFVH